MKFSKLVKKFIPKSVKQKIKNYKWVKKYKKYERKVDKQYILFGTPLHGNIGDHAITIAEYKLLEDIGINNLFEIPSFKRQYIIKYLKEHISKNAIIMINGGGFMGSQWIGEEEMIRDVVSSFPNNKIVIFPQTIYYKQDENGQAEMKKSLEIYKKHQNLVICTRERISYEFAKKNIPNANIILVPDIVLYMNNKTKSQYKRDGILACLRKDVEKNINVKDEEKLIESLKKYSTKVDFTDTVISKNISEKERKKIFDEKLNEFKKYKLVVTDRLHGMIFAAITNTPCLAIGNYNYKVKGVYEWIKNLEYIEYIENYENIEQNIKELLNKTNCEYKLDSINEFEKIKKLLKE